MRKVIEPFFGFKSSLTASPSNRFNNSQFLSWRQQISTHPLQLQSPVQDPLQSYAPCLILASFSKARLYAWSKLLSLIQNPFQSKTPCLVIGCLSKARLSARSKSLSPIQDHLQSKTLRPVQNTLPSPRHSLSNPRRLCPLQVPLQS